MRIPQGVQGWGTGQGQVVRSAAEGSAPCWDGRRAARAQFFPVLGFPGTAPGGFFPTLPILLCAALWAPNIHELELAGEPKPVPVLPWATGPAQCLARVHPGG